MPLYDYECRACGYTFEMMMDSGDNSEFPCPSLECPGFVRRIVSVGKVFVGNNDDRSWAASCVDVMDKTDKTPQVQEFIRNPTKANLKNVMDAKGLRHLEPGEKAIDRTPPDLSGVHKEVMKRHKERTALKVRPNVKQSATRS